MSINASGNWQQRATCRAVAIVLDEQQVNALSGGRCMSSELDSNDA
jgi:hypothetical protein